MKIPSIIIKTGEKFEAYILSLNSWMRTVTAVLSNGWTIQDQAKGDIKVITWNSDRAPMALSITLGARPFSVLTMSTNLTNSGEFSSGNRVEWTWDGVGNVMISHIRGLALSTDYNVTLWVVGS